MVTLLDALKHKDAIIESANDFGFENVRVHCEPNSLILQLLVKRKDNAKDYVVALEAFLVDRLNLHIEIMQENNLKKLYKASILKQSAPINEIEAIEKLYNKKISEILIEEAPNDIDSKNNRVRAVALAEKLLVAQKKPGVTLSRVTFFSEANEEKTDTDSVDETKLKRKAEDFVKDIDTKDFSRVLETIPDDIFNKLEAQVHEAKKVRLHESESARFKVEIKGH
jgi:hypothetical protein